MISIKRLTTGYWHARGNGPCEWAQWPVGERLTDDAFFPEASVGFRRALRRRIRTGTRPQRTGRKATHDLAHVALVALCLALGWRACP
jgi:hypothetical protein